jgi:hypothetical protein
MEKFWKIKMTKKQIRFIYWGSFSGFMLFIILPLFYFFYLFDEATVKYNIEQQFNNNDYKVEIRGNVLPKLWHGLSFAINDIILINKTIPKDQIYIKNFTCNISWLYLVLAKYKILRISINGININQDNLANLYVKNIVNLDNKVNSFLQSVNYIQIDDLNLINNGHQILNNNIIKIKQNMNNYDVILYGKFLESYDIKLFAKSKINNNNLNFDNINFNIANSNLKTELHSKAILNLNNNNLTLNDSNGIIYYDKYKIDFSLVATLFNNNQVQFNNLSLFINNLIKKNSAHTLLSIDRINLNILNYSFNINSIIGQYNLDLAEQKITSNFHIQNLISESDFITSKCNIQSNISLNNFLNNPISTSFSGDCNYSNKTFSSHLVGSINNTNSNLDIIYQKNNVKPKINIDLSLDNFILTLNTNVNFIKTYINNYFNQNDTIKYLFNINLNIKNLVYNNINFNNLSAFIFLDTHELKLTKIKYNLYGGDALSNLKVNYQNGVFNIFFNQVFNHFRIEDMLNDLFNLKVISGDASIKSFLTINNFSSLEQLTKHMNGYIEINAKDGIFKGIDLTNLYSDNLLALSPKSTIFDNLNAKLYFINGISHNDEIKFNSSILKAVGLGGIDVINESLNYKFQLQTLLPKNEKQIKWLIVPFYLYGKVWQPKLKIESIQLLKSKNLNNKLQK